MSNYREPSPRWPVAVSFNCSESQYEWLREKAGSGSVSQVVRHAVFVAMQMDLDVVASDGRDDDLFDSGFWDRVRDFCSEYSSVLTSRRSGDEGGV